MVTTMVSIIGLGRCAAVLALLVAVGVDIVFARDDGGEYTGRCNDAAGPARRGRPLCRARNRRK
jgi:hypothetical protein